MDKTFQKRKAELLSTPYLRILGEHESALCRLYNCFSVMFPGARKFWQQLAAEEDLYKEILVDISKMIETAEWSFRKPDIGYAAIYESIAWIEGKRQSIETHGCTMHEALDIAHYLENTVIERDFFKVFKINGPEARREFEDLETATQKHRQAIEDEAGRIKWKLRGDVKSGPADVEPGASCASTVDVVKQAQADIIHGLIRLEEAAALLYRTYADLYENYRDFWSKMEIEEIQHASMLHKLLEMREQGVLFHHLGRFNLDELHQEIQYAVTSAEAASADMFDLKEAVRRAFCVEKAMSESKFYEIVESDSEIFRMLAARLAGLTRDHVKKMEKMLITGDF